MATYTTNFNLKKPSTDEFFDIDDFNSNADIIDTEIQKKIAKPTSFTTGNLVKFSSGGDVVDTGKSIDDFLSSDANYETVGADVEGAADNVQSNLTAHIVDVQKHLTSLEKTKISNAFTTDDIVISSTQPSVKEGRIWIKVV